MISVIIPSYNRAGTITRAVMSVLNQTYQDLELWVIDDCSKDNTKEVLDTINDPRLHYYRLEKNSGACVARNKGIELSQGDFIAFNDSDDQWHPDKLEKQLAFLEQTGADFVTCAMDVKDDEGHFLHKFPKTIPEGKRNYLDILAYNHASTQVFFGKATCFKEILFDPTMPRLQDWDELLRLSQRFNVFYQDEVLVDTFVQKDSISTHPEKGVTAMEKLWEKHQDAIKTNPSIADSFLHKEASFVAKCGQNPTKVFKRLVEITPSARNKASLLLCRLGLYLPLFGLKNRR